MSQLEVPAGIEHLDFEPEKEEELFHHKHPTMPGYSWCGNRFKRNTTFMEGNGRARIEVNCPRCLDLIDVFGRPWYWETHRKFYGSQCTPDNHDCGA